MTASGKQDKSSIVAVYPGSFDPPTNGHIDIVERASRIFSRVIIAVTDNKLKKPTFTLEERSRMLVESAGKFGNVSVNVFSGLLVDYVRKVDAGVIIRGLRAVSDFEYEFQMALMNRTLDRSIEAVFLMPDEAYTYLSSSVIKEVSRLGGSIKGLVPPPVEKKLKEKYGG